jgi:hypothetical protein
MQRTILCLATVAITGLMVSAVCIVLAVFFRPLDELLTPVFKYTMVIGIISACMTFLLIIIDTAKEHW